MSYYEQDSYYAKDSSEHQKSSQWFGRGAKELGLFGAVAPKMFQSLLDGKVPNDGPQLGRMIEGKLVHDSGIDLTFSAPKSLSILAEIGPDRILRKIHDNAVKQTLSPIYVSGPSPG